MPSPTSLAPGFCRVTYNGTLFPHHMTIPVNYDGVPAAGEEPTLLTKDAASIGGVTGVGDMMSNIYPFFPSAVKFGLAEFHTIDETTGEDNFIFGFDLAGTGSGSVARVALQQKVTIYKTTNGGLYRLYMMESAQPINTKFYPPFGAGDDTDLASYITGNDSIVYGRGNAYPFSVIATLTKTNDALRKQNGLS